MARDRFDLRRWLKPRDHVADASIAPIAGAGRLIRQDPGRRICRERGDWKRNAAPFGYLGIAATTDDFECAGDTYEDERRQRRQIASGR